MTLTLDTVAATLTPSDRPLTFSPPSGRAGAGSSGGDLAGYRRLEIFERVPVPVRPEQLPPVAARWVPDGSDEVWYMALCRRAISAEESDDRGAISSMAWFPADEAPVAGQQIDELELSGPSAPTLLRGGGVAEATARPFTATRPPPKLVLQSHDDRTAQVWTARLV